VAPDSPMLAVTLFNPAIHLQVPPSIRTHTTEPALSNLSDPSPSIQIRISHSNEDDAEGPHLHTLTVPDTNANAGAWSVSGVAHELAVAGYSVLAESVPSAAETVYALELPEERGIAELLGPSLLHKSTKRSATLSATVGQAPLVAIYFSAQWCGPCRAFTPRLRAFVDALAEEGVELPVVFGSSDRDETSFARHFETVPWHAFPYGDARVDELKQRFGASFIPWLVILDAEGNVIANEADTKVEEGTQVYYSWLAEAKELMAAASARRHDGFGI